MPENFDTKRATRINKDRSFILGGQTLQYRASVQPEVFIEWSTVKVGGTDADSLPILDKLVTEMLVPESVTIWNELRKVADDYALSLEDITDVIEWLAEMQTGRPTEQPSASADGSPMTPTGTSSTASLDSPAPIPAPSLSVVSAT